MLVYCNIGNHCPLAIILTGPDGHRKAPALLGGAPVTLEDTMNRDRDTEQDSITLLTTKIKAMEKNIEVLIGSVCNLIQRIETLEKAIGHPYEKTTV